jgi:hypothetical protein
MLDREVQQELMVMKRRVASIEGKITELVDNREDHTHIFLWLVIIAIIIL